MCVSKSGFANVWSLILNILYMNNFNPLEAVARGCETQIQVDENFNYFKNRFKGYSATLQNLANAAPNAHFTLLNCPA